MTERKCIFITGAASGIGRSTALLFAEKGWFVGLFDVDSEGLEALSQRIGQESCCWRQMDVSNPDDVEKSMTYFGEQTGGRLDVLFNNAGIFRVGGFESLALEEHINTININVTGTLICTHTAFSMLKKTPGARIISMCSAAAIYGAPLAAIYSASKFAVRGMTEALNIEFEQHDILVSDIMVGLVQTPLLENAPMPADFKKSDVKITPEQIAETVWKAAHGNKIHWRINMKLRLFLFWLFPFCRRWLMKSKVWEKNPVKQ